MRKRRVWTTLDEDADEQESAALAASLAAAKDTAAESDALLSSAREDLTDHQRWLDTQSAAVKRDRERHERWLQRQKDLRLASAKKERIRRHRRLVRQRALQAIRQAFVDLYVFIRSWIAFGAGKTVGGVRAVARSIAGGTMSVWRTVMGVVALAAHRTGDGLSALFRAFARAATGVGRSLVQGARQTGRMVAKAAHGAGAGIAAGATWGGARATASMRAGSQAVSAGSQAVAAEAGKLSRKAGHALGQGGRAVGRGLSSTGENAAALAAATRDGVASGASAAAAGAAVLGEKGGRGLSRAGAWTASRAAAMPSKLFIQIARLGREVQHFARVRAALPRKPGLEDAAPFEGAIGSTAESISPAAGDGTGDVAHTASVHVFESYGPHPDGTTLFGQPANEPWAADNDSGDIAADAAAGRMPSEAGTQGGGLAAALAGPAGLLSSARRVSSARRASATGLASSVRFQSATELASSARRASSRWFAAAAGFSSNIAARTGSVLSSFGLGARARTGGLARGLQRRAGTGSVWLRNQAARSLSSARAGVAGLMRAQEQAVARGADFARKKGLDLSQMMIIAGAVLLVLGGLLIGGGFLMRSTADPVIAAEEPSDETFSKVSWTFDQPELPLPERAVFTLSGTPEAFLINGISIAGVNNSDEALSGLEASLSADVQRPDLKLDVVVDQPDQASTANSTGALVPPGAAFRLTFLFPPEAMAGGGMGNADGITVDDFFEAYGGLLLKLRYEADGAEKSVIHYLDPEMLKGQLDEVSGAAGGT